MKAVKSLITRVFGNWKMTALGAFIIYMAVLYREAFDDWVFFALIVFGAALFLGKDTWINKFLDIGSKKVKRNLDEDGDQPADPEPEL